MRKKGVDGPTNRGAGARQLEPPDEMSVGGGEWKLWREGEPFSQRFAATFSDDGNTIAGRWEVAEDGTNYTTDFDLIFRRIRWEG